MSFLDDIMYNFDQEWYDLVNGEFSMDPNEMSPQDPSNGDVNLPSNVNKEESRLVGGYNNAASGGGEEPTEGFDDIEQSADETIQGDNQSSNNALPDEFDLREDPEQDEVIQDGEKEEIMQERPNFHLNFELSREHRRTQNADFLRNLLIERGHNPEELRNLPARQQKPFIVALVQYLDMCGWERQVIGVALADVFAKNISNMKSKVTKILGTVRIQKKRCRDDDDHSKDDDDDQPSQKKQKVEL